MKRLLLHGQDFCFLRVVFLYPLVIGVTICIAVHYLFPNEWWLWRTQIRGEGLIDSKALSRLSFHSSLRRKLLVLRFLLLSIRIPFYIILIWLLHFLYLLLSYAFSRVESLSETSSLSPKVWVRFVYTLFLPDPIISCFDMLFLESRVYVRHYLYLLK